MDHLIHALVKEMLPSYQDCHEQQMLEMQGPNLAKKHQKDILLHTPETPLEWIRHINQSHLKSTQQTQITNMELIYLVIPARAAISLVSNCASTSRQPSISLGGKKRGSLDPRHLTTQVNRICQSHRSHGTVAQNPALL